MDKQQPLILVVDDEPEIVRTLRRSLTAYGYRVVTATNGNEALARITQYAPDLVLLDLLLPGMSGLEVCRQIRTTSSLPIIVLSVKDSERDKVDALDLGADDYVPKPFHMNEVLARIRLALRRAGQTAPHQEVLYRTGPLLVDFVLRHVQLNGVDLSLTPTEYELLTIFITYRGKLLTRTMLVEQLWKGEVHDREHSLHVYVARLRQKIEPVPEQPRFILTIPGVGYRFQETPEEEPSP
ncbi:MAG TPA: response regulator transcription factor [Ktedonobacteraceae bacterium]